jgi:hypothetical protein
MASDNRIASVNDSGWLSPHQLGSAVVVAQDAAKPAHKGDADVHIEQPHSLRFLSGRREVPNNSTLVLAVQFFNRNNEPYAHCKHLIPAWSLTFKTAVGPAAFKVVSPSKQR